MSDKKNEPRAAEGVLVRREDEPENKLSIGQSRTLFDTDDLRTQLMGGVVGADRWIQE